MPKRGQTEVVGLLVIVILLVFIGLIYLRFALQKHDSSQGIVREGIKGSSLLSAVLNLDIGDGSLKKRISDCSSLQDTCEDLKRDFHDIFSSVLQPGEQYSLNLLSEDETTFFSDGTCDRGIVTTYRFVEEGELFEARLTLCRAQSLPT